MANKKRIKKNKEKNVEKNILKEDDSFLGDVWGKLFVVLGVISFFCCFYLLTENLKLQNRKIHNSAIITNTSMTTRIKYAFFSIIITYHTNSNQFTFIMD